MRSMSEPLRLERRAHARRVERQAIEPDADGVVDGVRGDAFQRRLRRRRARERLGQLLLEVLDGGQRRRLGEKLLV